MLKYTILDLESPYPDTSVFWAYCPDGSLRLFSLCKIKGLWRLSTNDEYRYDSYEEWIHEEELPMRIAEMQNEYIHRQGESLHHE